MLKTCKEGKHAVVQTWIESNAWKWESQHEWWFRCSKCSYIQEVGWRIDVSHTHTWPNLMHSSSLVSGYMHHLCAVKRLLRYVGRTTRFGLLYQHTKQFKLYGFTDIDWGGLVDDRKSTSSWIFSLGSATVAWSLKKQEITALSSTEAEYIATTSMACQAVWMRRLLEDMNEKQHAATVIYCDNKYAIEIAKTLHNMEGLSTLILDIISLEDWLMKELSSWYIVIRQSNCWCAY